MNAAMAKHGAALLPAQVNVLHHCNTGALATIGGGTALGVIHEAHKQVSVGRNCNQALE
jgi:methylthioribose-1-phosphate isomerase